jgi:flagellar biosynthesis protein FliP
VVLVTVVVFTAVMVCVMRMGTCLVTVSTLTKPTLGAEKTPPAKPIKSIVIDTAISSTKPFESLKIFTSQKETQLYKPELGGEEQKRGKR